MKPKPDDRGDNVQRIQHNIDCTLRNMEMADELIEKTSDPKAKEALKDKNARRDHALDAMRGEIKDEAAHRENGKSRK